MKKITALFCTTLAALSCLTACSNHELDGKWTVDDIYSVEPGELFNEPVLELNTEKREYHGVTGINNISGTITLKGNNISFSDGPMTRMAADPHSMEVETAYLKAIFDTESYTIEGGKLYLKDCTGNVVMSLSTGNK